jgi:hypothetical protein
MAEFERWAAAEGIKTVDPSSDFDFWIALRNFVSIVAPAISAGRRDGVPMDLKFYLVDDPSFNAFAVSCQEADVIAMNNGVVPLLRSIFRALVSHDKILPVRHDGVPGMPISAPAPFRDIASTTHPWSVVPLADPLRNGLAEALKNIAVLFILAHEFTHIYNGHTDYHAAQHGSFLINEAGGQDAGCEEGFERETLEWDADSGALALILGVSLNVRSTLVGGRSTWEIPERNHFGTRDEALQMIAVAIAVCGSLFAAYDFSDVSDPKLREHPHPLIRIQYIIGLIEHTIAFRTGTNAEGVLEVLKEAIEQFDKSFEATFPDTTPSGEFDEAAFRAAFDFRHSAYEVTWTAMHDDLDQLKRGGTLAPKFQAPHPAFPDGPAIG